MAREIMFTAEFSPETEAGDIVARLTELGIDGAASRAPRTPAHVWGDFEVTIWGDDLPTGRVDIERYCHELTRKLPCGIPEVGGRERERVV